MKKSLLTFCLALIPSIATILLLIEYFPYTGLGRVISIPITLFFNSIIMFISLFITQKIKSRVFKSLTWIAAISITVWVAISLHPQEYLPSVLTQLQELIFSHTTK